MLLFFLTSLLTLNSLFVHQPPLPAVINEAIGFEQVYNSPKSLGIELTAKSALVMAWPSAKILFKKNVDQPLPIASLTKLMTALVFLDSAPDWQKVVEYNLEDTIPLQEEQKFLEPSQIAFQNKEKIKLKDLFNAALIKSANNAIKCLVRQTSFCCGHNFVELMNQKAQELGMSKTIFVEPTGLNPSNLSTADDLSKLVLAANSRKEITDVLVNKDYKFETELNQQKKFYLIKNTNKSLNSFLKILVGKTGYLNEAGYCFAGLTEYNKKDFMVILLGSQSDQDRLQEIKGLTVWAAEQN